MSNYFRITAYHPDHDFSVVLDSNGRFEKLWEFSAHLVAKGFNIIEVGRGDAIQKVNYDLISAESDKMILRSIGQGKPIIQEMEFENKKYTAICVGLTAYAQIKY